MEEDSDIIDIEKISEEMQAMRKILRPLPTLIIIRYDSFSAAELLVSCNILYYSV